MSRHCQKIKYPSQTEANAAILSFWRRKMNRAHKYPRRSYYCEECAAWHMTSMKERPND